jgi:hypothetical protein
LLGADTSIKSGEIMLVVWIQTSLVGEMISFQLFLGISYDVQLSLIELILYM